MPEFSSGEQKAAVILMTNPTAKAFDYEGIIYMGTNLAIVSRVSFSLNAGEQRGISFPVVMPSAAGIYPVYIGVSSQGQNIALYRSTEDVVIVEAIITAYALTVLQAPSQVVAGSEFVVRFQLDIPQEAAYVGSYPTKHHFFTYIEVGGTRSIANGIVLGVGRNVFDIAMLAKDWWYQTALPVGIYSLKTMMYKAWEAPDEPGSPSYGPFIWDWTPTGVTVEII